MIQLNLLPDVKAEFIKAQRLKHLMIASSLLACAVSVGILLLLLGVSGLQKKHINDLSADIKTESANLQKKPQINRILTVQNQLSSLTQLHDQKPDVSRLFDYLNQLTPAQVDITNFTIDFTTQAITVTGSADALSSVNTYVDTLKFAKYQVDGTDERTPAFNSVVLSAFGVSEGANKNGRTVSYTISFNYDPPIFDTTQKLKLVINNQVTTRSEISQPSDLFQASAINESSTTSAGGNN